MKPSIAFILTLVSACSSSPPVTKLELGPSRWIPFEFHNDEHLFVQGTINGHAAELVLDTGAEISLIDKSFAESIGLRSEGEWHVNGIAGGAHVGRVRGVEISVGNLTLRSSQVAIADFSGFEEAVGRPLSAILGVEVLEHSIVDIDYPNRRIAFRSSEDFEYDGPGHSVQLKSLRSGRHAIAGTIEDFPPAWYMIDTGSSSTITVAASLARSQPFMDSLRPSSEQIIGGIGGLTTEAIGSVERFSIGGFELRDMPISVSSGELSGRTDRGFDGIVGSVVLSRFRILMDFGRNEFHLEPGPLWQSSEFSRNLLGLALLPEGDSLRVLFVAPGSPAQVAGWLAGMFVTNVDGLRAPVAEMRAALRARNAEGAGTRVVLFDDQGIERSVVLARYY